MIPSAEATIVILQALAVPVIVLCFYLDGMVIGKVTPPAALYVAYVALVAPGSTHLFAVGMVSAAAATLGQFTLYRGFDEESPELVGIRRTLPYVDRIPFVVRERVGEPRMRLVSRLLDRFGGIAFVVTNSIPGIRSLMSIPAGLDRYPVRRFLLLSMVGNGLYLLLLTAVAMGLVDIVVSLL